MKNFILALISSFGINLQSQSLERQVIGSAGGSFNGSFQVDWTAGETVVATGSGGSVIITQGFQQPPEIPNAIKSVNTPSSLKAFPIPSPDWVTLRWNGDKPTFNVSLFNMTGSLIFSGKWVDSEDFKLDLSGFSQGIYTLKLNSEKESYSVQLSKS